MNKNQGEVSQQIRLTLTTIAHSCMIMAFMLAICALPSVASTACTTVTSTADDGSQGTLRYAIAQANVGTCDTIAFNMNSYPATITLLQGQLEINKNLTISGPGSAALTISGNNASRVFQIDSGANVNISGVTVTGANPGGVTVNSTTFNGSGQLTANLTIASGAVISGYDVAVTNADGRTGKGTDLFAVTQQGTPPGCSTTGTPSGFSLVASLNPVQSNGAALVTTLILGEAIR
jgi:hypothetical protein